MLLNLGGLVFKKVFEESILNEFEEVIEKWRQTKGHLYSKPTNLIKVDFYYTFESGSCEVLAKEDNFGVAQLYS